MEGVRVGAQILRPAIRDENVIKQKLGAAVIFALCRRYKGYLAAITTHIEIAVNCFSGKLFADSSDDLHSFAKHCARRRVTCTTANCVHGEEPSCKLVA